VKLLTIHFDHIENELDGPAVSTDTDSTFPALSLEHLELYQSYFSRTSPPEELQARHAALTQKVQDALKAHPERKQERSGDKPGNEHGAGYLGVTSGRRRQTCAVLYLNFLTAPIMLFINVIVFWYWVPFATYIILAYLAWIVYDNMTMKFPNDHRINNTWRNNSFYKHFRDYYPMRLMKGNSKVEYDPKKNFLFCYHPHGVQAAGAVGFGANCCGYDELFPGIKTHIQTLAINWKIPLMREAFIFLGAGNASKPALLNTLNPKNPGSSALLVTGGALESMYAQPYTSKVVLKSRAGFVKLALQTGSSLVPVWGYGENNLYDNLAASSPKILKIQRQIQKAISFAPLLVTGRGVFSYSGGLLPRRRPISVVVGPPIHVGKADPTPSQERIEEVHAQYLKAVVELFTTYKDIYDPKAQPIEFI